MNPPSPKAYAEDNYDPRLPAQSPHPHMATGIPANSSASHNTQMLGPWSTGLCDCFSDMRNCCVTCWCPFITFGQIAEILDEGTMTCSVSAALYAVISATTAHACMYSCMYRTKMRQLLKLQNTPCDDCLVHWCCECCALCQEYRELQNRGFDMLIGWQGNVGRQTPGMVAMTTRAPTIEPGMTRY